MFYLERWPFSWEMAGCFADKGLRRRCASRIVEKPLLQLSTQIRRPVEVDHFHRISLFFETCKALEGQVESLVGHAY